MKLSDYISFEAYTIDDLIVTRVIFRNPNGITTIAEVKASLKDHLDEEFKEFRKRMKREGIRALFEALGRNVIEEMGLDE